MNFEEEMNRFEAEITRNAAAASLGLVTAPLLDPALIPNVIHARAGLPPPSAAPSYANNSMIPPQLSRHVATGPATITAAPKTSIGSGQVDPEVTKEYEEDIFAKLAQYEVELKKEEKKSKKKKKSKSKSNAATVNPPEVILKSAVLPPPMPIPVPTPKAFVPVAATTAHVPASAKIGDEALKKAKKQKRMIRTGGGQIWEDDSLKEWDSNDFRIFCGDLGNDVTDEVLARTFGRYPSFQKAKVIRCKKSNKTKGYGFVSFKDPMDFTKAMREVNGKYVGSRPIKLRKSNWRERNIENVRHKQKEKQRMGYKY